MKKARILIWLAVAITLIAGYLDAFTSVAKYLITPVWIMMIICLSWGFREASQSPRTDKAISEASRRRRFAFMVGVLIAACTASVYLTRRSNLGLSVATEFVISLSTLGIFVAFLYWRFFVRPQRFKSWTGKRWLVWTAVAAVFLTVSGIFAFFDRKNEARRRINRQVAMAVNIWQRSPDSIERAEELIQHLRSIDTNRAPADVTKALNEYADALDYGVTIYKSGSHQRFVDDLIAKKKTALVEALNRHP